LNLRNKILFKIILKVILKVIMNITDLAAYHGQGTSLVTFILPHNAQLSKASSKIRRELSTAANIKSRV